MTDVMIGADLAQIECRMLAWVVQQQNLLEGFRRDSDIYCRFGSEYIYRPKLVTKDDTYERSVCKEAVLGCGFGMSPEGFLKHCHRRGLREVDETLARRAVESYRLAFPSIPQGWRVLTEALPTLAGLGYGEVTVLPCGLVIREGAVLLPSGRELVYGKVNQAQDERNRCVYWWRKMGREPKRLWGGLFMENIVQALARDVIRDAILRFIALARSIGHAWLEPVLSVHDELIWIVPESYSLRMTELIPLLMEQPPDWAPDLPVKVELHTGLSYFDLK